MRRVYDANPGDYVLCCKYGDKDPNDQWQVGFISHTEYYHNHGMVFVMQHGQRSYFKCCFLLTPIDGKKIIDAMDPRAARLTKYPVMAYTAVTLNFRR